MRAVQNSVFISGTLHIVHSKGVVDSPKVRILSVLPTGVPKHPEIERKAIKEEKISLQTLRFLQYLFDNYTKNLFPNLHTTRALSVSCQSSQTGSPPTKMFPS